MRESASWYIGCSRITELPSRQRDEYVVERGVMGREQRQLHAALFEQREQRRERAVQLYDREGDAIAARPHGGDAPHLPQDFHEILRDAAFRRREVHHVVRAQRRNQLLGSSLGDDLPVIHDRDAIAEALGFLHVMRREQDRAARGAKAADDLPQLPARLRVEPRRGLVEKEQLGLADERTGDREPLLLPAGQRDHAGAAFLFELDEREHFVDGVRLAVERSKQREDFADGELVGELCFLQLNAEPFAQGASRRSVLPPHAEDFDVARVGRRQPFEDLDRRRLAGAVRAEQPKTFAGADAEIEAGDRDDVIEALHQRPTVDRYDGFFSLSFSGGASCADLSAWSSCIVILFTPSASARTFIFIPVPARPAMIASWPATSGRVPRFAVSARWRMWDSSRAMLPQMLLMTFGFAARFDSSSATIFFT